MTRRLILTLVTVGVLVSAGLTQNPGTLNRGGFYPELDTVPEIDYEYVPTTKAKIFAGRPGKAALYSLILPGAGQAYNKKYWQVPIVWAGVGTAGGIMIFNIDQYNKFRDAYRERLIAEMEDRDPTDDYVGQYTTPNLLNLRDQSNRYRQMSIFIFALAWIANSAQAYVGAHLKEFDVSDDLSLEFRPFSGQEIQYDEFINQSNLQSPSLFSSSIVVRF